MHPIKTVLLLQDLHLGGTQRHAVELAKRLDPARFDTEIWTLFSGGGFAEEARTAGLTVRALSPGKAVTPRSLWGLWRALRLHRPQALLALTVTPNIWGRVFGALERVPAVIANCRGSDDFHRQHEFLLKHLAHRHICNAHALKRTLTQRYDLPGDRVDVIPTGVDTARFVPRPGEREPGPVLLCLARLSPVKDHETLVRAFELVHRERPEVKLRMVGNGELRERLAARMESSPARERMELLPGTPDPTGHFSRASAAVLSSVAEGMPNVLLEAMSMGLPCVGTDTGGVGEVIRHGRTGFVVPQRNPEALARALLQVLADEGLRERFGAAGRETALAEHSLESVAERHAEAVERALAR
ncbi:GDP-mannose-dependent alpha-(1-6)-phosphatidylinositol monomannoside mannosyltransferase [Fundidesulfovibrio magnetotacticus]|uniref:GDP-mannose-dependent alpha-(1-6)-phosphatidylinositol monomannoside mannosyltransferase n=1 Tax=Fundidesulfovibrio magnetotacticus TaxID=2730080 RepID=A0A6V8LI97_9BACT|nr:glycosyltransferase family 4 protein [Fundidesulfovibrio magnetotacticus]GFK92443.1 GDP-mannose-dependent alpha-(1-6)-phosphatidylinositol monomannoside mannosyltransferase [Fundidesulfovibrio magnetotacticus]